MLFRLKYEDAGYHDECLVVAGTEDEARRMISADFQTYYGDDDHITKKLITLGWARSG